MDFKKLEQPFNSDEIKEMQGRSGKTLQYVEGHTVIRRLNESLGNDGWSFKVLEHHIFESEVIVLGELIVGNIKKAQFGSYTMTDYETGEVLSVGRCLSAAATCSLKKCATMLGIGLYLYGEENTCSTSGKTESADHQDSYNNIHSTNSKSTNNPDTNSSNSNLTSRLSKKQYNYLLQLAAGRGFNEVEANEQVVSRVGVPIHLLTKQEASSVIQQMLN